METCNSSEVHQMPFFTCEALWRSSRFPSAYTRTASSCAQWTW